MNPTRLLTRAILLLLITVVLAEALWLSVKYKTPQLRKQLRDWRRYWDQA